MEEERGAAPSAMSAAGPAFGRDKLGSKAGGGVLGHFVQRVVGSSVFQNMVAGTIGASCTAVVTTPLDVVKTRMQAHVCEIGAATAMTSSGGCVAVNHYSGTLDALRRIPQHDGLRALWRGLNVTLVLAVPTTGVYFTLYDQINRSIVSMYGTNASDSALFAGALARVATATAASPLEVVRTRIQSGMEGGRSVVQVLRRLLAARGVASMWRGIGPTLLRDAPFSAIYWYSYEKLVQPTSALSRHAPSPVAVYLLGGIGAGSLAAAVTTPMDVLKTRRQAANLEAATAAASPATARSPASPADASFPRILGRIAREEGFRGFFAGFGPRVAKVAPSCAIMMTSFELIRRYFRQVSSSEVAGERRLDKGDAKLSAVPIK